MQRSENDIPNKQSLKQQILLYSMQAFSQHGIRNVTMDHIAQHFAISKRTLYEVYANKESIIIEGILYDRRNIRQHFTSFIHAGHRTVMDVLIEFFKVRESSLRNINPQFLMELLTYPKVQELLKKEHYKQYKVNKKFFEEGIKEGYFMENADYELISRMSDGSFEYLLTQNVFYNYPIDYIFRHVFLTYVRGLCTSKGIEELDKRISKSTKGDSC